MTQALVILIVQIVIMVLQAVLTYLQGKTFRNINVVISKSKEVPDKLL